MTTIQELSSMTMLEIMEKMNKMEQENKRLTDEINKKKVGKMNMTIEELEVEILKSYKDLEDEEGKNEKQENKITLLENKLRGIKRMLGNFK